MTVTEAEMLEYDYYGLTDDELVTLFMVESKPTGRTRLHALAGLYHAVYPRGGAAMDAKTDAGPATEEAGE